MVTKCLINFKLKRESGSDEDLLPMLTLDFRIFLDKTKVLIRTVEELREKTWELDTSTRSKDQKLIKSKNSLTEIKKKKLDIFCDKK